MLLVDFAPTVDPSTPLPLTSKEAKRNGDALLKVEGLLADWRAAVRVRDLIPYERREKAGETMRTNINRYLVAMLEAGPIPSSVVQTVAEAVADTDWPKDRELLTQRLLFANNSPRIPLAAVRDLAERLSFAIFPAAYLVGGALARESDALRRGVAAFQALSAVFSVYVLAPVGYYSPSKQIAADKDLPIYASKDYVPTFAAISMLLPSLRWMQKHLQAVSERVVNCEEQIKALDQRVGELGVQIQRQREAEIARELKLTEIKEHFIAQDPMLLAIPQTESIHDNGAAIVGPCWGPEFQADVVQALKLTPNKHAAKTRKLLAAWIPTDRYGRGGFVEY